MSPARATLVAGAVVSAGTLLLAGCSGTSGTSSASPDSINYALPANFTPNWILPIGTAAHLNTNNRSIADSLWERLVAYDGSTGKIAWNKPASVATAADFASDSKSVTFTLGDRTWSDGKPITSRDVEFWFNLIKANKEQWAGYTPGKSPDNWTSFKTVDDHHFTITFDRAYNSQWMLANELTEVTPLPQHVWDKTAASAAVSDADRTAMRRQAGVDVPQHGREEHLPLREGRAVEDHQRSLRGQVLLDRGQGRAHRQQEVRRR